MQFRSRNFPHAVDWLDLSRNLWPYEPDMIPADSYAMGRKDVWK